jgi:hypothetical protein
MLILKPEINEGVLKHLEHSLKTNVKKTEFYENNPTGYHA